MAPIRRRPSDSTLMPESPATSRRLTTALGVIKRAFIIATMEAPHATGLELGARHHVRGGEDARARALLAARDGDDAAWRLFLRDLHHQVEVGLHRPDGDADLGAVAIGREHLDLAAAGDAARHQRRVADLLPHLGAWRPDHEAAPHLHTVIPA